MDLYCKRCGEPYEIDYVNWDMTPDEKKNFKTGAGCPSCFGKPVEKRPFRAEMSDALESILGDDIDGLAAEMEDAEWMLGGKFWE
jgi:hypothetical protein